MGWSRTELLPRKLDERAIVRARESREGVAERAAPVARERQDHARSRALQLAQRRGVALSNLDVLLQVQRRAAALVEQRDANLPRAVLEDRRDDGARGWRRRRRAFVRRGGHGGAGCEERPRRGRVPFGGKRATTFEHPAETSDLLVSKACFG